MTVHFIAQETATHNTVSTDDYTFHRILCGIPEGTPDIVPMQAFPMESNLDAMGARECVSRLSAIQSILISNPQLTLGRGAMLGKS